VIVADLVEAAAARHPEATAVLAEDGSLTYAELDARANALARHLQSLGVGPDVTVGVSMHRSVDLAVALLGVLKAGGACLPLDPTYPDDRLEFMADDAGVVTVLTDAPADGPAAPPPRTTGPEHLAYVIYTSGSTGRPKGVMLTHRGLVNHHRAVVDLYGLGPGDRVLQFCSLGFDASIEEIFPTWAAGATVVFRPEDAPLLGRDWLAWLRDRRVTVMNLPTAYWHAWVRDLDASGQAAPEGIRLLVVGGEKALGPSYRAWRRVAGERSRWINAYGPTETTCMSTFYEASGDEDRDPPIGRPLRGTTVAVIDGELLIGGLGLARGYLNAPELTAERFVQHGSERMYRTGDLVRELPGGDLDYLGRVDEQVKIRGFRIETGEVEAALVRHPGVAEAVVVARDDSPGDRHLVAYVVGGAGAGELRSHLAARLPAHMVPPAYVTLDALPLTPNGKVDRDGLPAPERTRSSATTRTSAEDRLAVIWAGALGLDAGHIGPDDDFFELGGHSLVATQVIAQVRDQFGTTTPLRAVFQAPTLAGLASLIEAEGSGPAAGAPLVARRRQPGERFPLSLAQEQMWALEVAADPPGLQNVTALHRFDPEVDLDVLQRALDHVVGRHEILRTGFVEGPSQFVGSVAGVPLLVATSEQTVRDQNAEPFDLARPPLVRACLYPDGLLAVTFDHLVCDGTGAEIFLGELLAVYEGRPLPALPIQFADFAVWQRANVTEAVVARQLEWWRDFLAGMPLGPSVPFDHLPDVPTRRIESRSFTVDAGTRAGLDDLARATGSSVFTVAVAAAGALFGGAAGTTDVVMSTTLSGRTRAELEDLVGMFSGIGRLRTDLSGDPTFADLVTRTRERVLGMFENQDIPFMRVRREVAPDFPTDPRDVSAALPTEFQYFHVGRRHELFFRGQLHPLSVTLLDDGSHIGGQWSYKLDYYEPATVDRLAGEFERLLSAVVADPSARLSELAAARRA
jgi:amino acid adenylation domain-containing protein